MALNYNHYVVSSLKLSSQGSGYTSTPTITISGGGAATGATATALLSQVQLLGDSNIGGDGDLTINAVVSGNASLTKVGTGTTTLNGVNTYTGNTAVDAGTLSISNAYLADAADVYLKSGAIFDLNFAGTDTIDSLFFGSVSQATGTWAQFGRRNQPVGVLHRHRLADGFDHGEPGGRL